MKKLFLFIASIALFSCIVENERYNEIEVQIINDTDSKVDSISLYVYMGNYYLCDSVSLKDVNPNTEKTILWSDVNTCNSDGAFLIKAFYNDTILEKSYGYYTNGILLDDKITISIFSDSLVISSVVKKLN